MSQQYQRILTRFIPQTICLCFSLIFAFSANAQKRDHLTDAETDLVRYWQELDKRTDVFIKCADRRWTIINGGTPAPIKKAMKDEPDWGDVPKGTRAELLGDIAGILDEAITNIDNAAGHDSKNPLLSRALRKLNAAANNYVTQLNSWKTKTTNPEEVAALERINDEANEIIAASGHLPSGAGEEVDEKGKKKKKP
jgi:hypothetical protein